MGACIKDLVWFWFSLRLRLPRFGPMRHAGAVGHGRSPPARVVLHAPSRTAGLRSSGCVAAVSGLRPSGVVDGLVRVRFVAPYEPARLRSDSKGRSRAACGAGPPAAAVSWCWACRCAPVLGNDTVSPALGQDFTTCVTFPKKHSV